MKFEQLSEVVHRFSSKWVFLKFSQIPKENTCVGDTFLKSCNPEGCSKETSTQVFYCEICKIF